jgi:hypothetical protein
MAMQITTDYAWHDKQNQRTRRLTAKSHKSKKFYPYISITYLLYYLIFISYLSHIHLLSITYSSISYSSLISHIFIYLLFIPIYHVFLPPLSGIVTVFCLPAADSSARIGDRTKAGMTKEGMKTRLGFRPPAGALRAFMI